MIFPRFLCYMKQHTTWTQISVNICRSSPNHKFPIKPCAVNRIILKHHNPDDWRGIALRQRAFIQRTKRTDGRVYCNVEDAGLYTSNSASGVMRRGWVLIAAFTPHWAKSSGRTNAATAATASPPQPWKHCPILHEAIYGFVGFHQILILTTLLPKNYWTLQRNFAISTSYSANPVLELRAWVSLP
jgi:hypothetical protein